MSKVIEIIEDSRKKNLSDEVALEKVIKFLPEKKEAFQEAQKRGATPTQILDKIVADNKIVPQRKGDVLSVVKIIEEGRENYAKDDEIIIDVIKFLPEKKEAFQEAQKRGATPTQILDKIVADNKKSDLKEKPVVEFKRDQSHEGEDIKKDTGLTAFAPKKKESNQKIKKKIAAVKGMALFSEFFAITRYLLLGIDISDYSIEIMLIDKDSTITSFGRILIESEVVHNGEILNQKKLSDAMRAALISTKPNPLDVPEHTRKKKITLKKRNHKAIISLPESKTYIHLFKFTNKNDIYTQIEEKIKITIPFDYDDLYWDFTEVSNTHEGVKILCVAAQRDIVDSYIYFFKSVNVDPVAFEIQGASVGRALLPIKRIKFGKKKKDYRTVMADGKSRMIVDMGAKTTTLNIFNEEAVLTVSVPLPYAGKYFTKKIAEHFEINEEEANKIKEEEGFLKEKKSYNVLRAPGEKIVNEIYEASKYYKREFGLEVKEVILVGGTSLLPGIVDFFSEKLEGLTMKVGDPLKKINDLGFLENEKPILFSNVIGLSLRSLLNDPIRDGLNLLPDEIKNQERRSQTEKQRSVLLVALFIAIVGIMFLALSAYYLIYLPVPAPIQPLQQRVLLTFEERGEFEMVEMAFIREDLDEPVFVMRGPGENQEIIGEAVSGESYQITIQLAGWFRIVFEETEGWIFGENIDRIESVRVIKDIDEDNEEDFSEEENPEDLADENDVDDDKEDDDSLE